MIARFRFIFSKEILLVSPCMKKKKLKKKSKNYIFYMKRNNLLRERLSRFGHHIQSANLFSGVFFFLSVFKLRNPPIGSDQVDAPMGGAQPDPHLQGPAGVVPDWWPNQKKKRKNTSHFARIPAKTPINQLSCAPWWLSREFSKRR